MYCPNCGKAIAEQSNYCTFCGTAIKPESQQHNINQPNYSNFQQPLPEKRNGFYNLGFWGGILILLGAFLPWFSESGFGFIRSYNLIDILSYDFSNDASYSGQFSNTDTATVGITVFKVIFITIIICSILIIIDSFVNYLPKFLAGIFSFLPFFIVAIIITLSLVGSKSVSFTGIIHTAGIGIWTTFVGLIFLLFYRKQSD